MCRALLAVVAVAFAFTAVGCSSADYSKNMRAATAQATATVSTKVLLDEIALDKYDGAKAGLVTACTEVSKFLDTGKIGDLPIEKAQEAVVKFMIEKGWIQYVPMVIAFFDIVAAQTVPIEKLGEDNIAMIKMGLEAAIVSANTSKQGWRRPAKLDDAAKTMKVKKWHSRDTNY